ncbi:MAG: YbhB/YbcL family Raf kinase inhibitor-like protein [Lacrimispora celerecrescens]|uniref:YbhB/YbcL family Raf kinase inhibitor-like protein n=1 Tax=Lacrimispora indolis TaxID=69825 RepID=UPI00041BF907|nr:YbhB/YbcL family Raf kinase inhibitor-like protein [[Clostridium] methoxybenzovorans]MBE7722335.1 YbhB/YbcL family Raf kinase inhibitor-like protein [Lacrimispora celerecrescens]
MKNNLTVTSPAFENEAVIPVQYTGRGEDISPELHLSSIDENAKSLAVIMDDMGHPIPAYNHWVIWNIPIMEIIPQNIPHGAHIAELNGATQGRGYGRNKYRGPKPPFNWSHRYQFNVYVLDCLLDLPVRSRKRDVLAAMEGHVLQEGCLVGRFR